ncbi:MAG: PHP domain-containing protein [candidate division WOR-3 bacterium]|nr:PHP domain-containing protein [candidate division WOR-3 bacterium]
MTDFYADLHIHTTHSDGVHTPGEIIEIALKSRIFIIAITDHDSVSGIDEAIEYAQNRIEIIPAVELSSNIGKCDIHILGYYIDHHAADFIDYLEGFKAHRLSRAKKIVEKLNRAGIKIDFELVKDIAKNSVVGRPHIAEALVKCGYVRSVSDAFYRYLGYHCPFYEPKKEISPKEAIEKIKRYGGIPIIAHPGMIGANNGLIYKLIDDGARGIEVWHPEHTRKQEDDFYEIAMKHGLLITGGSDFHGYPRGYCKIGEYGCDKTHVFSLKEMSKMSKKK